MESPKLKHGSSTKLYDALFTFIPPYKIVYCFHKKKEIGYRHILRDD